MKLNKGRFKALWFSDCHGWLADMKALGCINNILKDNKFDEVGINGDIVDMPYISAHARRLHEDGILSGYSEIGEIEYTRDQILRPLRLSTKANIVIRIGNHDERITKPFLLSKSQLATLQVMYKKFNTQSFDEMLGLKKLKMEYDPSPIRSYFNMFDIVHGLSLAKSAQEKNIMEYMGSGASGHSHRLGIKYITNKRNPYCWLEMGCTRIKESVEYIPTAKMTDWQSGFIDVEFVMTKNGIMFFATPYIIINGTCMYNGTLYTNK